jgi:hypothetical protein
MSYQTAYRHLTSVGQDMSYQDAYRYLHQYQSRYPFISSRIYIYIYIYTSISLSTKIGGFIISISYSLRQNILSWQAIYILLYRHRHTVVVSYKLSQYYDKLSHKAVSVRIYTRIKLYVSVSVMIYCVYTYYSASWLNVSNLWTFVNYSLCYSP